MVILTLKHLLDHGVSDDEWLEVHATVASSPVYLFYSGIFRTLSRLILAMAFIPLSLIRTLPAPLQHFSPREFYRIQWIDDLHHIRSSHYRVMYACARVVDAWRIVFQYNILRGIGS